MIQEIVITTGINGCPSHLHPGYIGFGSYEEAAAFAKEHGGDVVLLHKREGQDFWMSDGTADGPLKISEKDYGCEYSIISSSEEWLEECRERITNLYEADAEVNIFFSAVKDMESIMQKVDNLQKDEAVLLHQGDFVEVIKTRTMSFAFDSRQYAIGVELSSKTCKNNDF